MLTKFIKVRNGAHISSYALPLTLTPSFGNFIDRVNTCPTTRRAINLMNVFQQR